MSDILPLAVYNPGFILEKHASECGPMQFLREFTQNGIEAITADSGSGVIEWREDIFTTSAKSASAPKLCVFDTGVGMSREELSGLMGALFSSGKEQSVSGNFGVGAKISALTRNPYGLVYTTLKDGVVSRAILQQDASGNYGLKLSPDGQSSWRVEATELPQKIRDAGSGTIVTFLGSGPDHDTTLLPLAEPGQTPSQWLTKYLNSRYFKLPEGISVTADRTTAGQKAGRRVRGQEHFLEEHKELSGTLQLADGSVEARWWVLKEAAPDWVGTVTRWRGHVAALLDNELYETSHPGSASYSKLRACGVTFGCERVVIYFFVSGEGERGFLANTARDRLISRAGHGGFPWDSLFEQFRLNMPKELAAFVEKQAPSGDLDAALSARQEKLLALLSELGLKRFRRSAGGSESIGGQGTTGQGDAGGRGSSGVGGVQSRQPGNRSGPGAEDSGVEVRGLRPPLIRWGSVSDGTIPEDDEQLVDRAARYVPESNTLLVNSDFRGFVGLEERWRTKLAGTIGAEEAIRVALQEEVSVALIEAVLTVLLFKGDKGTWSAEDRLAACSPEALTLVAMQRSRFDEHIARATKKLTRPPSVGN